MLMEIVAKAWMRSRPKYCLRFAPATWQDFFEKIALFSSRNSRYQELKANCEAAQEMEDDEVSNLNATV